MNINFLQQVLKDISVVDALNILCQDLGAANAFVYINNTRTQLMDLHDSHIFYLASYAREIPLRFYGGPPRRGAWFDGTLTTMLIDHIAYQQSTGNIEKAKDIVRWIVRHYQQLTC